MVKKKLTKKKKKWLIISVVGTIIVLMVTVNILREDSDLVAVDTEKVSTPVRNQG